MTAGLGDPHYLIAASIDKRPAFMGLDALEEFQGVVDGEIAAIGQACGNGWRKVFNVYAKLMWALASEWRLRQQSPCDEMPAALARLAPVLGAVSQFGSWQAYRDDSLLRADSGTALLFTPPCVGPSSVPGAGEDAARGTLYLVMGRGYGKALAPELGISLCWHNESFAIERSKGLIVCPYFDYRQLSDSRIQALVTLISTLS